MRRLSYITGTERAGIIIAAITAIVAFFLIIRTGIHGDKDATAIQDSINKEAQRQSSLRKIQSRTYSYGLAEATAEPFAFDPNTADSTQLLRLGLQPWQVRNIYKYRAKGGVYRRKSDFARLYGLTKGQYKRLEPYISISEEYGPAAEIFPAEPEKTFVRDTVRFPLKIKKGEHIALNTADTAQLKRVPGIGSHFAAAVASYRNRLGGFYSTSQLKEIDGFPIEALPYFTADASRTIRIDANKATLQQLRRHPYIGYYLARTIIEHRRLHGSINSFDDLKLYRDFTPEVIGRLKHYLEFK